MLHLAALLVAAAVLPRGPEPIVPTPEVHAVVSASFQTGSYTIQSLDIPQFPGGAFVVPVSLDGQILALELQPASIRSPGFRVLVPDGFGGLTEVPAPPARTVEGRVSGAGGRVVGSVLKRGLTALIETDDGSWVIQPLGDALPADRSLHVVMSVDDLIPTDGWCPGGVMPGGMSLRPQGGSGARGSVLVAEARAEADFAMFGRNGADLGDTVADVEMIMQAVTFAYERDVGVSFDLQSVLVRTTEADDPYTSNDSGELLSQFRTWWNTNQGALSRDLVHLFTGRDLDGSIIGLAYTSVVCSNPNWAYGLSQSRYTLNINNRVALTAHEIGHNFSATHCSGDDCHIMCPTLGGCGGVGLPNFGPVAIGEIGGFAQSGSCLESGQPQQLDLPVVDQFPVQTINPGIWSIIDNALITNNAVGEPSPPWVALIHESGALESRLIDLAGPFDTPVTVSFWLQTWSVESGETLAVRYTPDGGTPVTIATLAASSPDTVTFGTVRLRLPPGALGGGTSIGLVTNGDSFSDNWSLDDFRVEQSAPIVFPVFDDFAWLVIDQLLWPAQSGAAINQGGVGPPSPPNVLSLDRNDWIESATLPGTSAAATQDVWADLWLQSNGVEASKPIELRYRNASGSWITVWRHAPKTTGRSPFQHARIPLPQEAEHSGLALRLQATGADGTDDWFIDDVRAELAPRFAPPWMDSFDDPDELIEPGLWYPIEGAVINQGGVGNPSGASVLNLDWADRLTSRACYAAGLGPGQRLVVRMWAQHNGVESGKNLFVDYRSSGGAWLTAWSVRSNTSSRRTIGQAEFALPADGAHATTQIRLRTDGVDGTDDWFVDDLSLTVEDALVLPVSDSFPAVVLSRLVWADDDAVAINSGAVGNPSAPYVMNLDVDEYATTQAIDASGAPGDSTVLVTFWLQHNGIEPGKHLFVDYTDPGGVFRRAGTFTSGAPERITYGWVNVPLGADAVHGSLQVRLSVDGADGSDDWFIDDLLVHAQTGSSSALFEPFATTRLDPWTWRAVAGSPVVNAGAPSPPSPPYVLNLDRDESLETVPFESGVLGGSAPSVGFFMQHNGVEPGKSLAVDLVRADSSTLRLDTFVSESTARSAFDWHTLDLPLGPNEGAKIRFTVIGPDADDDWFLDDVFVGQKTWLGTPWTETFESALSLGLRSWSPLSTASASDQAQNEPSGVASLRIQTGQSARSLPVRLGGAGSPQYFRAWVQHAGGGSGDQLAVLYTDSGGVLRGLRTITPDAAGTTTFRPVQVELPPDALHDQADFSLVWQSGTGTWYVDDVYVGPEFIDAGCAPDLNGDGMLDFFDLQAYLNAFAAHQPSADMNGDGQHDFFDVQIYLGLFSAGCE